MAKVWNADHVNTLVSPTSLRKVFWYLLRKANTVKNNHYFHYKNVVLMRFAFCTSTLRDDRNGQWSDKILCSIYSIYILFVKLQWDSGHVSYDVYPPTNYIPFTYINFHSATFRDSYDIPFTRSGQYSWAVIIYVIESRLQFKIQFTFFKFLRAFIECSQTALFFDLRPNYDKHYIFHSVLVKFPHYFQNLFNSGILF